MNKTVNLSSTLVQVGVPLLLILVLLIIVKSSFFGINPGALSVGITFDLVLTIPIYFLLIRKKNIPKITVVPIFILGVVIASFLLPNENQFILYPVKTWVLPIVEITVLIFVVYKVRTAVKSYKENKTLTPDYYTALKSACLEILPRQAALIFASEVALFYYAFFTWKKYLPKTNEFSYHKNSGTPAVLIAIIFIVLIETTVIHLLLLQWSPIGAWILTIISLYSGVMIFSFLKSIKRRFILIADGKLYLRYGILNEATIDLKEINAIELTRKSIKMDSLTRKLSPFGDLESHNLIIRLKNEHTLEGYYGFTKKFKTVIFNVDDPEELRSSLNQKLR